MKSISIRFNNDLANWITDCAKKAQISISEFIRNLLYEKMQQGSITLSHIKILRSGLLIRILKVRWIYYFYS